MKIFLMMLCIVFIAKDVFLAVFNYKKQEYFMGTIWLIPIPVWAWNLVALFRVV